ncbi:MAG: methyltransferase [Marinilabiliaceae bacterium]|nr:methyltransferase [Marinilabiliaceae bacterium]
MANSYFAFKQFVVKQERTAMKVGTDGVLLGVVTAVKESDKHVLDIGTGTGLVALMMAQRLPSAKVMGIEIDEESAFQAEENCSESPFADRVRVERISLQEYKSDHPYDLIVCNPPFYNGTLTCPDDKRTMARHALSLTFHELAFFSSRLLTSEGRLTVIIPTYAEHEMTEACGENGLFLCRRVSIFPTPEKPVKRLVLEYSMRQRQTCDEMSLVIEYSRGEWSSEFRALVKDFYLKV